MKSPLTHIIIKGARQHNLKNINLEIPKNNFVVFTGVSGSGKSSLALDTIYAEGQRRYVESLSSYARQFLGVMDKPDVERIEGLSPAIAIDQKTTSKNPRSTVGTNTEVYDFLRLLFARIGHPHCPKCGREIQRQSSEEITDLIIEIIKENPDFNTPKGVRFIMFSPVVKDRKGEYSSLFKNLKKQGIIRARVDGNIRSTGSDFELIKTNKHTIEALISRHIIDKKKFKNESKDIKTVLYQSVETALRLSEGNVILSIVKDASFEFPENPKNYEDHLFSEVFACPECNISLEELEPRSFSFNSPHGACPVCGGIGTKLRIDENLIINSQLSIKEGAIMPWAKLFQYNTWMSSVIRSVCEKHSIPLDKKYVLLSKKERRIILHGTGSQKYKIKYTNREGDARIYTTGYEGVIPNLIRRHKETQSDRTRSDIEKYMIKEDCPECLGTRLKDEALSVTIQGLNIAEVTQMSVEKAYEWFKNLGSNLNKREKEIAQVILKEINYRVGFLVDVGLGYLSLDRASANLSGGESQRIRLASQIGTGLSGVLYVLDEPSVGLHQKDQSRLINTLKHLKELGNTIIVVEHDMDTIMQSDYIFDFGPGAGDKGGKIAAEGTPQEIISNKNSLTGQYLSGKKIVGKHLKVSNENNNHKLQKKINNKNLLLTEASGRNLKNINLKIPLGKFTCITGVSGSGKSTLIMDTLYQKLRQDFGLKIEERPEPNKGLAGLENIDKVIAIDQSPIGRTPRSNPATYTKVFDYIRELFSKTEESRIRGYKPGRFSFNVKGGRCEACGGDGQHRIEMQFMPDVYVTCDVCKGKRYNREALEITYKNKNIADILDMPVEEALEFFKNIPKVKRRLQTLMDVGLGYIKLGQPAPTLSGGEAQRIKLALELSKRPTGSTLYILDEPTTGLHFADLEKLISIFKRLTARGNTVVVIEHNMDIIRNCDWVVDLGPEGGERGGEIVYEGSLADLVNDTKSYTAEALRKYKKRLSIG